MSSSWIEQILAEARQIGPDDFIEPSQDLGEGDHPAGQVPILARQLWTYGKHLQKRGMEFLLEAEYSGGAKEHKEELKARSIEWQDKASQVLELFWSEIKDSNALWGKAVGIRVGWVAVWLEEKKNPQQEFLRNLWELGGEK